jgi:hypothetical protein
VRLAAPAGRHIYSQCHRWQSKPQRGGTYHAGCRPAGAQFGLSPCVSINISPRWGSNALCLIFNSPRSGVCERDSSGTTKRMRAMRTSGAHPKCVKVMERIARRELRRTSAPLVRVGAEGEAARPKTIDNQLIIPKINSINLLYLRYICCTKTAKFFGLGALR